MQGMRDGEGKGKQPDKTTTDAPWTLSPWVRGVRVRFRVRVRVRVRLRVRVRVRVVSDF